MKVYMAMSGTLGCLPDYSAVYRSRRAAEDDLIAMFGIERTRLAGTLRRDGVVCFGKRSRELGAEYAEVVDDILTADEYRAAQEQ